jgi:uncharacterized phage protein (TIGR01671 family)
MIDDRFLPRVWTDEGYYYPIFSELGITYENKKLPFTKENLKDINWAFRWRFNHYNENVDMEYINTLEQCTGLKDKNGKLIYENDLIKCPSGIYRIAVDDFGLWTAIYKNNPFEGVGEWSDMVKEYAFNQNNVEIEVLGNIHENADLLEVNND